jgi:hypothetical protein
MNFEEKKVLDYYSSKGIELIFEPNGKSTFPDFHDRGNTFAIEVRRLNEHVYDKGKLVGAETAEHLVWRYLPELCDRISAQISERVYLGVKYNRPLPKFNKTLEEKIERQIELFLKSGYTNNEFVLRGQEFSIIRSSTKGVSGLFLMVSSDEQTGGNAEAIIVFNVKHCIKLKNSLSHPAMYELPVRLHLVNTMPYSLSDELFEEIRESVDTKGFNSVYVHEKSGKVFIFN